MRTLVFIFSFLLLGLSLDARADKRDRDHGRHERVSFNDCHWGAVGPEPFECDGKTYVYGRVRCHSGANTMAFCREKDAKSAAKCLGDEDKKQKKQTRLCMYQKFPTLDPENFERRERVGSDERGRGKDDKGIDVSDCSPNAVPGGSFRCDADGQFYHYNEKACTKAKTTFPRFCRAELLKDLKECDRDFSDATRRCFSEITGMEWEDKMSQQYNAQPRRSQQ
jgi:hypothetical protein